MSGKSYVIGVDGGGTKTLGILTDSEENVLARGSYPSSNIHSVPHPEVEATLRGLVESLCEKAGIEPNRLGAICLGMAGCDSPGDRKILTGFLEPVLSEETELIIINDAIVAMRAVLGRMHGLLLIAGTGSICFGWNERTGEHARSGGWGHLLADEGSGYRIGLEGIRAILRAVDGRGPKTVLADRILPFLEVDEPRGVLQIVYGPKGTKAFLGGIARFVMEADQEGDEAAAQILDKQAAQLAELVVPVYGKLFANEEGRAPLGLWGGNLVHAENYRNRLLENLNETGLPIDPVMAPGADAVLGAARHALTVLKERASSNP